ncbi:uncharacterized protein LOC107607905 [Arachis ipaensis]|uniref:uncharacterized protein LOC107607905 n=1 Tax=Arachis ipaensis TaxID=130454 RepID=UPI0007AFA296|nr:uncharacterized protein LOC107607905 [Arachis ipaensis]
MASEEESTLVLVHCSGKIQRSKKYGVKFTDREPLSIFNSSSSTLSELKNSILQKLGVFGSKWVKKLFYKISITVVLTGVKYDTFVLAADEDIRVLFHCVRSFPEVRIHELFAKLEVGVDSSGALAPVHSLTAAGGASSSMPVVRPPVPLVGSPSFTADLDRTEVGSSVLVENPGASGQAYVVGTGGGLIHDAQGFGEPDRVENAMCDDDSDQEPVDIVGDSDNDTGANPHTEHGHSSSGTQQYPPHFSTLNLEALGQQSDGGPTVGGSSTEFQIGQLFQNKDKAVLSVKDYPSRCSVQSHRIRPYEVSWKMQGVREGFDHRQLDYHVICARILPLVKADAAVTVKVLQQATEADYGFRPSYRKVWMAKQKAVVQIYGDWEESYAELPRWMLGVQSIMPGTVTVLKTSHVLLGGEVDESTVYFHRLFWTFLPCIEAFRHCKPLVSIDGTHLYGKYGGTLLLVIAQDGNSNILPIAFALVKGENAESWAFFLSNLRSHVTLQEGLLVISTSRNTIIHRISITSTREVLIQTVVEPSPLSICGTCAYTPTSIDSPVIWSVVNLHPGRCLR